MNIIRRINNVCMLILLLSIVIFPLSCVNEKSDKIEVIILNESIKNNIDTIEYLVRNISNKEISLTIDPTNFYRKGLDDNIINFLDVSFEIYNEEGELIVPSNTSFFPNEEFRKERDSFLLEYNKIQKIILQKKPHNLSNNLFLNREYIKKNTIRISPKKEMKFKTPVKIYSYEKINSLDLQYYALDSNRKYFLKIKIPSNIDSLKQYLFNENTKIHILSEEYESNKVPIKVVEFW